MNELRPSEGRVSQRDRPNLPETHYVANSIYTDPGAFDAEQEHIFRRVWLFVCHESEVANPGDFRTTSVAGAPIVVCRDTQSTVRAFYNVCRHRGAQVVREEAGSAKSFRCFYHLWVYGLDGHLQAYPLPEGYKPETGFCARDFGLQEVRVESVHGLVFVCPDPQAAPLAEYLRPEVVDALAGPLGSQPLEVFHFHRVRLKANWKLWRDNSDEFYHNPLHHANRDSGPGNVRSDVQPRWRIYRHGHHIFGDPARTNMNYQAGGIAGLDEYPFPTAAKGGSMMVRIFPDFLLSLRSNVVRIDRMVPIAPGLTLVEHRGLGLAGDAPEVRARRLESHNYFWGPAGWNLAEDIQAVELQQVMLESGVLPWGLWARDADSPGNTGDENSRDFYRVWTARTGIQANDGPGILDNGSDR
ncbi:MAG: aromatic ring-hydroxylating oxygenase subunit alpha [Chloroflexota bacterium]